MKTKAYPSFLNNKQWDLIKPFFPKEKPGGRPRSTDIREVVNAILYVNRTGIQWRYLPHDFPPWETVFGYYDTWKTTGVWRQIHDILRDKTRKSVGRDVEPTAGCMDSQSVKTSGEAKKELTGFDAAKHINGKKRHILVDTLGLLLEIVITPANVQDRDGGREILNKIKGHYPRLKKIFVDSAYAGLLVDWAQEACSRTLEVVKKLAEKGFHVLPFRWIVERTFGWLNRYRRLAKDYEKTPEYRYNMIYISLIDIMLNRLAGNGASNKNIS